MGKKFSKGLLLALGAALLAYSALRSIDFIQMTLPDNRAYLAYFAVAASELGLVFWLLTFLLDHEAGTWQSAIALLMILIDLVGCVGLFTVDTLLRSGEKGLVATMDTNTIWWILVAMSGLIAVNIGAEVSYHIFDPAAAKGRAQREALGQIEDEAIKMVKERSKSLAAELSVEIADDWMTTTRAMYRAQLGQGRALPLPPPSPVEVQARPAPEPEKVGKGRKESTSFLHWPKLKATHPGKARYNQVAAADTPTISSNGNGNHSARPFEE
jgi:hypothetical protein